MLMTSTRVWFQMLLSSVSKKS